MSTASQIIIKKKANGSIVYHRRDNDYDSEKQNEKNININYSEYIELPIPKKISLIFIDSEDYNLETQSNNNSKIDNLEKQKKIPSNKKEKNDATSSDEKKNENKDNKKNESGLSKVDAKVEEPIKVFRCEVKSPLEWFLTDDKIITPAGTKKLSDDYMKLVSYIFSTFFGSGLGLFLMSTGIFSGLGVAILIYANTPTPVLKHLCKKVDSATGGFIPLGKYTSITEYTIKYINNAPKRISEKVKKKEEKLKLEKKFKEKRQKMIAQTKISLLKQQIKNTNEKTDIPKENGKMANTIINNRNNKNNFNTMTI